MFVDGVAVLAPTVRVVVLLQTSQQLTHNIWVCSRDVVLFIHVGNDIEKQRAAGNVVQFVEPSAGNLGASVASPPCPSDLGGGVQPKSHQGLDSFAGTGSGNVEPAALPTPVRDVQMLPTAEPCKYT